MEEGLKAFHKITINIADQDERIWRQTAAKKCLKKEIEKIEEQSKRYEIQIETLKKDPLFGKYEESNRLAADNINEHIQMHKLLSLAISSKRAEIEQKEKDLRSWDQKYAAAIADLKEAYYMKRDWIESTNPTFKKLMDIKAGQKAAEVRLKQLKAETARRQRNREQLRIIKKMIFHKTIVNFVNTVQRKKKYLEISYKLKNLEETNKKMVKEMFETQEAMKKCKVRHTPIPSGIFPNKTPGALQQLGFLRKIDTKRITELIKPKPAVLETHNPTMMETKNQSNFEENKKELNSLPNSKKRLLLHDDRLKIISNKIIALPPLKTILSKQRSKMETSFNKSFDSSFNKSQSSQVNSQKENEKTESIPKLSQEGPAETKKSLSSSDPPKEKILIEPSLPKVADMVKPSDCLKNLKFTTQSNKFQLPKVPTLFKQNSQLNQKTSILKSHAENTDYSNLDTSLRRKEKNVNFASPIQQSMEIDETSSSKEDSDTSAQLNKFSNFNMSGFSNGNIGKKPLLDDDTLNAQEPQFSFETMDVTEFPGNIQRGHNMVSKPIFGDGNENEISFGFSFGGPSKSTDEIWDLFG